MIVQLSRVSKRWVGISETKKTNRNVTYKEKGGLKNWFQKNISVQVVLKQQGVKKENI